MTGWCEKSWRGKVLVEVNIRINLLYIFERQFMKSRTANSGELA